MGKIYCRSKLSLSEQRDVEGQQFNVLDADDEAIRKGYCVQMQELIANYKALRTKDKFKFCIGT